MRYIYKGIGKKVGQKIVNDHKARQKALKDEVGRLQIEARKRCLEALYEQLGKGTLGRQEQKEIWRKLNEEYLLDPQLFYRPATTKELIYRIQYGHIISSDLDELTELILDPERLKPKSSMGLYSLATTALMGVTALLTLKVSNYK
jgi:hypothetical protein